MFVGRFEFGRRKSEKPEFLVRPTEFSCDHIPFPTAHTRHLLRFRQSCFAAFEFFLGSLALDGQGDLISHGGEELQVALAVSAFLLVVLHGQYADGPRRRPQGHTQPGSRIGPALLDLALLAQSSLKLFGQQEALARA